MIVIGSLPLKIFPTQIFIGEKKNTHTQKRGKFNFFLEKIRIDLYSTESLLNYMLSREKLNVEKKPLTWLVL